MSTTERRQYKRVSLVTKVTYVKAGVDQFYYSKDISEGGIFIKTKKPHPVGTRLQLHFTLPKREFRIDVWGEVARVVERQGEGWNDELGMGIKFTEISEEARAELKAFLEGN
jgi:type IV pilus assembly protein PilZ